MIGKTLLIVVALASLAFGGGASWFVRGLWFDWFDRPAIIHEQQAICTADIEAAAAKATRDEQLRQFRIGEAATEQFIIEQKAADDVRAAERDQQEQENADYERKLLEAGRVCALDGDDLDFLGVRREQDGALPGGGGTGQGGSPSGAAIPAR